MIQEDYVSFETAKLLKEKGFCAPCFAYYSEYVDNWKTLKIWRGYAKTYDTVRNNGYVLVPTLQTAMKWLREVHHIIFVFKPSYFSGDECTYWTYERWCGDNFDGEVLSFKTYEEACETAIKYCLDNLI